VPMMGAMKTKRFLVFAVLSLLAACSEQAPTTSPEPAVDPEAAVLDAMTAVYEAGTMHEEFRMEMSAGGQSFEFSGEADVDNDHQRVAVSMDLGMMGGEMDMVMDGGVMYMRSPAFTKQTGTEWVSVELAELNPAAAAQFGGLGGTTDPSAYVGLFAGMIDVEVAGEEAIGGVATTHYHGTIDIGEVLRRFPEVFGDDVDAATRKQFESAVKQFESAGIDDEFPFDIWIDEEGYPRRETFSMNFSGLVPGADEATMEMTVDLSAFGEPIEVEVPAPKEVTDLTDLVGAQGGSG
jgi:hypothetical protein